MTKASIRTLINLLFRAIVAKLTDVLSIVLFKTDKKTSLNGCVLTKALISKIVVYEDIYCKLSRYLLLN